MDDASIPESVVHAGLGFEQHLLSRAAFELLSNLTDHRPQYWASSAWTAAAPDGGEKVCGEQ